jgi:flagellar basal body-associated protein FliL
MGILEKIEALINHMLILIGDVFMRMLLKIISPKVQQKFINFKVWCARALVWCKNFPSLVIRTAPLLISKVKSEFLTFNFKEKLAETYKAGITQYKKSQPGAHISEFKTLFLAPFLMMGQWLKGLSTAQTMLLLGFTSVSVLAGINMVFTGQRLLNQHSNGMRGPASVEEEVPYDRPAYYKKQSRHLDIVSLRLPVYFANVNELRSIDVDFSATMSNRQSRMQLEKLEFQLRDHLILNVEPMLASFPLEEEGKEILREKLTMEINDFLKERSIEGEVKEIKLIYILAN